jgi:Fic family protein
MVKKNRFQQEYNVILNKLGNSTHPLSLSDIEKNIEKSIHKKTLQRRLKSLVEDGFVETEGKGRNQKYYVNRDNDLVPINLDEDNFDSNVKTANIDEDKAHPIFSSEALSLLSYLETPSYGRVKTSYQVSLIESYIPNKSQYVPDSVREQLHRSGKRFDKTLAAGTYAKHIGQRLLIDLSYHSSRLEGNTYSKLDTQKLIENGLTAEGKVHEETVMIMNHKEAILFLIENAEEIPLSSFTIRNIHYLLSQDLLKNPNACGKVRQLEVNIGKSSYLPLNNPHQLKEHLALLLRKSAQINDPFEQSFFLLIHISYLQAFEDVNKRTARLTCNIPFIKGNLCPLSFIDVPQEDYLKALLYFYEKNDFLPALELFQWAYIKSCEQYNVVKDSLGEIDSYRVQYRIARKEVIANIIREGIRGSEIELFIASYCDKNSINSPDKFITIVLQELETLHSGMLVSLGITESIFEAWKASR